MMTGELNYNDCDIVSSGGAMYKSFCKLSSSSIQVQNIVSVMKKKFSLILNKEIDYASPVLLQGMQESVYYFCILRHTEILAVTLLAVELKSFGRN